MKISTSYLFDRSVAQMSTVQNDLAYTQSQVSAGKQVLNPSDAPDQAASIQRLKTVLNKQESYSKTLTTVKARLQGEDSTLKSMSDMLIRAKEIAMQASNDTMSPENRQALGVELKGLRDQMLSLANGQDSNGNYLFSGSRMKQPPFTVKATGQVTYQGDQTKMHVQVGDQRSIALNRSGTEAFVSVKRTDSNGLQSNREFFGAIDDLISGMNSVDRTAISRGVNEMDTLLNGVGMAQANVGTDMNVVDQQSQVIDDTKLTLKTTLSNVEDLDMAAAITKMNKQMLSLQASQSSFAKISQLNLFNFIK
jgi:flagellar hook-associated protein 3 FlgL